MVRLVTWLVVIASLVDGACSAAAEAVGPVFRLVNASVVIVRTRERDVEQPSGATTAAVSGLGSGVVIDSRGYVLTAAHVVQTVDEVAGSRGLRTGSRVSLRLLEGVDFAARTRLGPRNTHVRREEPAEVS
jgi:S1-C subfamily serine protease